MLTIKFSFEGCAALETENVFSLVEKKIFFLEYSYECTPKNNFKLLKK